MKITNYLSFAVALVQITLTVVLRPVAAFAIFTAFSALFYAAALGAIFLILG
jgi:hypothetical protein